MKYQWACHQIVQALIEIPLGMASSWAGFYWNTNEHVIKLCRLVLKDQWACNQVAQALLEIPTSMPCNWAGFNWNTNEHVIFLITHFPTLRVQQLCCGQEPTCVLENGTKARGPFHMQWWRFLHGGCLRPLLRILSAARWLCMHSMHFMCRSLLVCMQQICCGRKPTCAEIAMYVYCNTGFACNKFVADKSPHGTNRKLTLFARGLHATNLLRTRAQVCEKACKQMEFVAGSVSVKFVAGQEPEWISNTSV
jgi:hypothetical protein